MNLHEMNSLFLIASAPVVDVDTPVPLVITPRGLRAAEASQLEAVLIACPGSGDNPRPVHLQGDHQMIAIGTKFGKWTVIGKERPNTSGSVCLCRCECGTERPVRVLSLVHGRSRSCGCLRQAFYESRKATARTVTAWGETKSLAEWSNDPRCTVTRQALYRRLKSGWTPETAISSL